MSTTEEKVIEVSKTKVLLFLALACICVALGFWLLSLDEASFLSRKYGSLIVHGFGLIAILVFSAAAILNVRVLFDRKPGLVFSSAGVLANRVSAALIPWSEIAGVEIFKVKTLVVWQRFLVVRLVNPEKYIELGNALKRSLNRSNYKMYGSPIIISSGALEIDLDELHAIFRVCLAKYGKSA